MHELNARDFRNAAGFVQSLSTCVSVPDPSDLVRGVGVGGESLSQCSTRNLTRNQQNKTEKKTPNIDMARLAASGTAGFLGLAFLSSPLTNALQLKDDSRSH